MKQEIQVFLSYKIVLFQNYRLTLAFICVIYRTNKIYLSQGLQSSKNEIKVDMLIRYWIGLCGIVIDKTSNLWYHVAAQIK